MLALLLDIANHQSDRRPLSEYLGGSSQKASHESEVSI